MLEEHTVYYGQYYHQTVPVIINNIVKTLGSIQAADLEEDDEDMEL